MPVKLTINFSGEVLGYFADFEQADAFHDRWSDRFGFDPQDDSSLAPSVTFAQCDATELDLCRTACAVVTKWAFSAFKDVKTVHPDEKTIEGCPCFLLHCTFYTVVPRGLLPPGKWWMKVGYHNNLSVFQSIPF